MTKRNKSYNGTASGQVNKNTSAKRWSMVRAGKASYYQPYRSLDDALKTAGLADLE